MLRLQVPRAALIVLVSLASQAAAQAPAPGNVTMLHLSETADRNVTNDRLRVDLAAEAINADAVKLQDDINRRMAAALARANAAPDVTAETSGYSLFQDHPNKGPALWHGSQSLTLIAKDFDRLLALVGTLQHEGLVMKGLTPMLSTEARRAAEDDLTQTALDRLQQRAARIATGLGTKVEALHDIRVGNAAPPPPLPRMMAAAGAVPPVAAPGEAQVSVTVFAEIALAPRP